MATLVTNSQRAQEIVRRSTSGTWAASDLVEMVECELNRAEDRGSEAAAMLAASRGHQMDDDTRDALLTMLREGLAFFKPAVDDAAIDHRARSIVQSMAADFEVRLLDEPTEPTRGPAR